MNLIDMHCDTLWKVMDLDKKGDLLNNQCSVSIPSMRQGQAMAQFFACFVFARNMEGENWTEKYENSYIHVREMAEFLKSQTDIYQPDLAMAGSYTEIMANTGQGKISAVLTVEDGGVLNGHAERIQELYSIGIRLVTLLWNDENCIGYPNSRQKEMMEKGLKPFGIEVVERMNGHGMIIDVSHASDGTFWDVLKYSKAPVAASHSNCRALCSHPRNLSDEMIRSLAEKGGVAGLNFYGPFLGSPKESRVEDMVRHILHMIQVGGSEFPAIGTDFDGFDGLDHLDVPDTGSMNLLWQELERAGLRTGQLEKIWSGNVLRVMKEVM